MSEPAASGECAVLGHWWPAVWEPVAVPASRQHPAIVYWRRACRRCPATEARSGRAS